LKIAILGTRGIPNYHGGFEQFAEYFATFLTTKECEVYVYNSHTHPYQEKTFKNVNIIHCYDPETHIGTAGQFIYDFNCIRDARKRNFDIILQLGYTSSSIWHKMLPKSAVIITNMDGLEWKRTKYSKYVQKFLKYAEKLAVLNSHFLVSDSIGIQDYLLEKYKANSKYIPYGADVFSNPDESILKSFDIQPYQYNMLIARLEPENNIEVILDGVVKAKRQTTFLVIGKFDNKFGIYLKEKYKNFQFIKFIGGLYNLDHLNNLRYFSNFYFHGHSVGGTNPSLLEAMASKAFIVANDNIFNVAILNKDALYFNNQNDVAQIIDNENRNESQHFLTNNLLKIGTKYSWDTINQSYYELMKSLEKQ
jgi:hypothetical protein